MKGSMTNFIAILSESKFEILEEIIESKYSQFIAVYWLVKGYSDYITKLKYKETNDDSLKIDISLTKLNMDKVINEILEMAEEKGLQNNVNVSKEGRVLHVQFTS